MTSDEAEAMDSVDRHSNSDYNHTSQCSGTYTYMQITTYIISKQTQMKFPAKDYILENMRSFTLMAILVQQMLLSCGLIAER